MLVMVMVQRDWLWGVILALQANDGVHLGVDNLGVIRGFLMVSFLPVLLSYCRTVIFFFLLKGCCAFVG